MEGINPTTSEFNSCLPERGSITQSREAELAMESESYKSIKCFPPTRTGSTSETYIESSSKRLSTASPPSRSSNTDFTRTNSSHRDHPKSVSDSQSIVALIEGRGIASEIGLAVMDIRTSYCSFYQFADSPTYSKTLWKLSVLNPIEVRLSSG